MPRLNSRGEWCAGIGGAGVSIATAVLSTPAGEAFWLSDDEVVYHTGESGTWHLEKYTVSTGIKTQFDSRSANSLVGGGSRWAAWLGGLGVYGVYGAAGVTPPVNAVAGVAAAGRDGTVAIRESYSTGLGFTLISPTGVETVGPSEVCNSLQVLGPSSACWISGGGMSGPIHVLGVTDPAISESVYGPKMVQVNGIWWVFYGGSAAGSGAYVGHIVGDTSSLVIIGAEHVNQQYGFDAVAVGSRIYYAYSLTQGEEQGNIVTGYIDTTGVSGGGSAGTGGSTLSSSSTFQIVGEAVATVELTLPVYPAWPIASGYGRLIHPDLGAFDYEVKPDEWMNIDEDAIIAPVWASTRTLTGAANALWSGNIRDVVVEERWKALGGLAMPISQLRMLLMIWTNPVDPVLGYVRWYPNYVTQNGYNVLPVALEVGGRGITFDDVVNYLDADGNPDGWVTNPVTFTMKLVARL